MIHEPDARLASATDALYRAFAPFPYRQSMPACAHCVTDEDLLALGAYPVRDLPPDLVARYVGKAVSTWGEVVDFKRVLPRLLELSGQNRLPVAPLMVTSKLARARWAEWPPEERRPVWQFLLAWWHDNTSRWTGPGHAAHTLLGALAVAEADLGPYLSDWQHLLASSSPHRDDAISHLMELLCDSPFRPEVPSSLERLFWDPAGDAPGQMKGFLLDPLTSEEVERALGDLARSPQARRLAVAFARLTRFRRAAAG